MAFNRQILAECRVVVQKAGREVECVAPIVLARMAPLPRTEPWLVPFLCFRHDHLHGPANSTTNDVSLLFRDRG